jgi:hypothetical protein
MVVFLVSVSSCGVVFGEARAAGQRLVSYRARSAVLDSTMWAIRSDFYNYDDQMNMYVAVLADDSSTSQLALAETTYQQAVQARDALAGDLDRAAALSSTPKVAALVARLHTDFVG